MKHLVNRAILAVSAVLTFPAMLSAAAVYTVPVGLNPGDPYRIVFVTSEARDATSTDINDYNDFVNTVANAPGSLLQPLGATWFMIGSTSSVSAAVNIGGASSIPIYLLDGTLVATGAADLFDGTLASAINLSDTGEYGSRPVWTGTNTDGAGAAPWELGGSGGLPQYGLASFADSVWIAYSRESPEVSLYFYGISETLTVPDVPEPGTAGIMLTGFALIFAAARKRRKA